MKKRYWGVFALFLFCFSFIFTGKNTHAASAPVETSINNIAYVDTAGRLVLKFTDFCNTGYTYTVTKENDAVAEKIEGSLAAKQGVLTVSLGNLYAQNSAYQLVLTGKDNAKKVTLHYYTGRTLSGYSIVQNTDDSIKASWIAADKTVYTGYNLGIYLSENATVRQTGTAAGNTAVSASIASTILKSGRYYTYLLSYKKINNVTYYGQGLLQTFDYARKPAKVSGVTVTPKANGARIAWTPVYGATSYTVYKSTKMNTGFSIVKAGCTQNYLDVTGLKGGKTYYFRVTASSQGGAKNAVGPVSLTVSGKIPVVAGQVKNVKLVFNSKKQLTLTWSRTKLATGYRILYKLPKELTYRKLGDTKKNTYTLNKLDSSTKYNIKVCAFTKINGKKYLSSKTSQKITVSPTKYKNKNYNKLLAGQVRTIGYIGGKCIYTTKKYSTEVKTAFVNSKGYSSKTKYLIWISHYTQQVSIFKGSKGKWKMIRTFTCATGTAQNHSPIGVFKISYKEKGWFYATTKELYVTHYCGRNSFHTRPLWNNGAVENPTIGRPVSHGCVRCYNQDAKYIYDKMPIGTTVVSY